MRRLYVYGLLAFAVYYMVTGSFGIIDDAKNGNLALLMSGITKNELDSTILEYYKNTVLENAAELSVNAINKTVIDLNEDGKKDVIAVVESSATCGTGGCIGSIFMENDLGELAAVPFQIAVKKIEVLQSMTEGMHDLRVNGDETSRLIWNGTTYVLEQLQP